MIQVAYVLFWWLALVIIGLISFPLTSRVCSSLADKGYSISKLVGLLILTYLAWMISSLKLLSFGWVSILISFLLLAALSLYLGRKNLRITNWPRKSIIISETIFTVAFVVFLLIMMANPDIHYTMDYFANFSFVSSITRGGYLPPMDPWFSGESLPYYYYGGHLLVSVLTLATRVPPAIAFNIAAAMFAALAVSASYGLGYNITRRKLYGFLAAFFVCIVGYISGAYQLVAHIFDTDILGYHPSGAPNIIEWLLEFEFWNAGWLIEDGIVHYPYFQLVRWDMHSYVMSIPFQLMFITLIFALFRKGRFSDAITRSDTLIDIFILGLCLGFFVLLNTWEYPTYIVFTLLAFVLLKIRPSVKGNLLVPAVIVVSSFLLYIWQYTSMSAGGFFGLGLVTARTSLAGFFEFGALFLFAVCSLLFILSKRELLRGRRAIFVAVFTLLATILAAILLDFQLLIIVVPVGLLSLYYIYKSKSKTEKEFVLLFLIMGAALAFFCDFIYIDDALGGTWERFNTVTKVYMQIWVFLAISAACAVFYVLNSMKGKGRIVWVVILIVFVLASVIHPVASTTSALSGRHPFLGINSGTLDGMAYLEAVDKGDYEAIQWINENIHGSPVILEAPQGYFDHVSRISVFTGLPTIIGWEGCEITWGRTWDEVGERRGDVDMIYNTPDNDKALALLAKYDVEYIYIGAGEREAYESEGLAKFATRPEDYTLVYEGEGVTIYEVRE